MEKIKFSIITVSYNSKDTIARTIESVIGQTYKNLEYCIIDGNSTDGTVDIIKRYHSQYPEIIKYVSEPDSGIYDAMNKGVLMSTGNIVGIVNSDDWLELDALENVSRSVDDNGNDLEALYCGGINYHFVSGEIKQRIVNLTAFRHNAKFYIVNGVRHPGLFVPKSVYDSIGVFCEEMKLSADADFMLRCYFKGIRFIDINAIVSNMSEGGLSTCRTKKAIETSRRDRKILLRNFNKKGLSFLWLYYSWFLRGSIRRFLIKTGLYR